MSNPKEKAIELIDKYSNADYTDISFSGAKQCALITVDEILLIEIINESVDDFYLRYWIEVKNELEKL
jgi:hypothetical protein